MSSVDIFYEKEEKGKMVTKYNSLKLEAAEEKRK